jgi:hypothetical protein
MRLYTLINAYLALIGGVICLIRLGIPKDWPVVLKYEQWEYVIKVVSYISWALWGFLTVYR